MSDLQNKTYVPLHSHYDDGSLLDGLGSIAEYVEKAKKYRMPGLCKTDHGRIGLFLDFYKKCKENGINPIIGCEFYVSHGKYDDKSPENKDRWHITCFAKDNEGLKNIFHLSYEMNKNGFYYKPRIDDELLFKYKKGIICLSGCASSEICSYLRDDDGYEYNYDKAVEVAQRFKKEFGDDYYIELQDHVLRSTGQQWEIQDKLNKDLTKIAKQLGIKRVLAADNHYCNSDDELTHEVLLCIGTGKKLSDTDRMSLREFDLSIKAPEVLYERWKDDEEVLLNTLEVNDKVNLDFNLEQQIPPIFKCPDGMSEPQYLKYLTYKGAIKRYVRKNDIPETISECIELLEERIVSRLEKELAVINKLELNSYILMVQEYINWAKNNGIRVGPGRGSSMGSLVCYCTNITALDPIDDGSLMFERFINADRISMADIDSDFEAAKRPLVIQHLRDLYGEENVAAIGVFGTMRSKNAFRDVARVLDYPFEDSLKVTKLIPEAEHTGRPKLNEYIMSDEELKNYLNDEKAVCEAPEFRDLYHSDSRVKEITDIAVKLEGRYRNHGIHACATVVAPTPIWNFFPVEVSNDIIATTVPMHDVEEGGPSGGLWKIDVLGLSTLDLIEDALRIIKSTGKQVPDIDNIPLDDYETLKLYREGRSKNTFTFSSPGMRHALMGLKVDKFSDLTLVNALYRPGAMDYIDNIIRRKFGQEEIKYMLNDTEHILKDTYGYVAYQEQGIRIALQIGFSGGEADNMRKALAKKNKGFLDMIYPTFKEKAMACGNTEQQVEEYWESLIGFSRYSFNYAHALAYAFLGYQTGYLKAHYPAEYMAAYFNHVAGDKDKLGAAIEDARTEGIEVTTPNVLYSDTGFAVDNKGKIVYSLSAIKKVGKASETIIENRKHNIKPKTLGEFMNQFTSSELTRGKIEALAKGGAFDCFAENEEEVFHSRAELLYNFDKIMDYYKPPKSKKNKKQAELFDMDKPTCNKPELDRPALNYQVQTLFEECEYIGNFISDSPINYIDCEESENWWTEEECLKSKEDKTTFTIPIIIMNIRKRYTKTGKKFAKCECLTNHGQIEITMWTEQLEKCEHFLSERIPAILYAIPDMYNDGYKQMKYVCRDITIVDYKTIEKD